MNNMKTSKLTRSIVRSIASLAATLLLATACSNELTDSDHNPPKQPGEAGKVITVTATQGSGAQTDGPQTRLTYDFTPTDGSVGVTWAKGDKFYVGKEFLDGKAVSAEDSGFKPFTLNEGEEGSKSGNFTGTLSDDVAVSTPLYAVYGKEGNAIAVNKNSVEGIAFGACSKRTDTQPPPPSCRC